MSLLEKPHILQQYLTIWSFSIRLPGITRGETSRNTNSLLLLLSIIFRSVSWRLSRYIHAVLFKWVCGDVLPQRDFAALHFSNTHGQIRNAFSAKCTVCSMLLAPKFLQITVFFMFFRKFYCLPLGSAGFVLNIEEVFFFKAVLLACFPVSLFCSRCYFLHSKRVRGKIFIIAWLLKKTSSSSRFHSVSTRK